MPKWLRVNPGWDPNAGQLTGANYRLPADANLDSLRDLLLDAMNRGEAMSVSVELGDNPLYRYTVVINASQVHSALIAETPEPDE